MKQALQSVSRGRIFVADVPPPQVRRNGVLVRTGASIISPGTERVALEFGQMSLIGKARSRPDLVRQVLDKVRRDGFLDAARVALARLEQPQPLGYACAGTIIAVGSEASEFEVGDHVACAGAGYAGHAEVNYVPRNLAVPIPTRPAGGDVSFEEAAFATLGAIALHGTRLAQPGIGERAVVIGLGLIGLIAGQILRAHGCVVLGVDPDVRRVALAWELGFAGATGLDAAVDRAHALSRGLGADLVLITAASADSRPVVMAAEVARDRARIVAVGATGLDLPRRLYYQKELSLVVSRSYGPGRYDPNFEERGQDYPAGYVRWTERENMRAFLDLVADDRVRVEPLISHRVDIAEADDGYRLLDDPTALGIVLRYPTASIAIADAVGDRIQLKSRPSKSTGSIGVSVVGAGNFAQGVLLPVVRRMPGVELRGVVTGSGATARWVGDRFGFRFCASEVGAVWDDAETDAVIIATPHHLHAGLVRQAVAAGKAVFVEKPLCVSEDELDDLVGWAQDLAASGRNALIMVGFNRRFAPSVGKLREFFGPPGTPLTVSYRINAGPPPEKTWMANTAESGGRVVSEVCHFVDLSSFLVDAAPVSVFTHRLAGSADDIVASLRFANGSLATIGFYSTGDRSYSKERIEVFGGGAVACIDDFRGGWLVRNGRRGRIDGRWSRQQKGHREELEAFIAAVRIGGVSPVPFAEAVRTMRATFAILESLSRGTSVDLVG